MNHSDGVPEVWGLACWRHILKYSSISMGGDLHSTPEAARIKCADCLRETHEGLCRYRLKEREPVRLWPPQKGGK
jgi:hypothetical protein